MVLKVLVPVARGTEEMEAVIIIDLLRRANINVIVAGESEIITCSRGVKLIPDVLLDDVDPEEQFSAVVLPGGLDGTERLMKNSNLEDIVRNINKRGGYIGAICAAPTILHNFKVLNSDTWITSHPSVVRQLERYNYSHENVVSDNNIITSRGAGTATEFALTLIGRLINQSKAHEIAEAIVYRQM